jgi:hypothetical protein
MNKSLKDDCFRNNQNLMMKEFVGEELLFVVGDGTSGNFLVPNVDKLPSPASFGRYKDNTIGRQRRERSCRISGLE